MCRLRAIRDDTKSVARLQFKSFLRRGKVDRSSADFDALVEAPKAPRGVGAGRGCLGGVPSTDFFYYLTSKWSILVLYLSWI